MDIEWTVALPTTARPTVARMRSDVASYRAQLDLVLDQRSGYTEVSVAGSAYPTLALSVNGDLAIVLRFDNPDDCQLLAGSGLVDEDRTYEFRHHGETTTISGEFILTAVRGADLLLAFAEGAEIHRLGTWIPKDRTM